MISPLLSPSQSQASHLELEFVHNPFTIPTQHPSTILPIRGAPRFPTEEMALAAPPRTWRFVWPEKSFSYEFVADLGGSNHPIHATCNIDGTEWLMEGKVEEMKGGQVRLEYILSKDDTKMHVMAVSFAPHRDTFAGHWKKLDGKNRAAQSCLLLCERDGGGWWHFRKGDRVRYKEKVAVVLTVQHHSAPEYFYEIQKSDGGVADVAEDKLLPEVPEFLEATL